MNCVSSGQMQFDYECDNVPYVTDVRQKYGSGNRAIKQKNAFYILNFLVFFLHLLNVPYVFCSMAFKF